MKTYLLRKGILLALKFYGDDMACNVDDVSCHARVITLRLSRDDIKREMENLAGFEYIKRCDGFGGEYYKITPKGLRQINPEFSADRYITGRPE